MVYLVGLPPEKDTGANQPAIWINPEHIVQLAPDIDGPNDARRLIVELKLIGLPIIRSHFGAFASVEELDVRWQRPLDELEHEGAKSGYTRPHDKGEQSP